MNKRTLLNLMDFDLETRAILCDAMREDGLIPGCPGYVGRHEVSGPDRADATRERLGRGVFVSRMLDREAAR